MSYLPLVPKVFQYCSIIMLPLQTQIWRYVLITDSTTEQAAAEEKEIEVRMRLKLLHAQLYHAILCSLVACLSFCARDLHEFSTFRLCKGNARNS